MSVRLELEQMSDFVGMRTRDYNHREIFLKAARKIEALRLPEPPQGEKFGFVNSRR